MPIDIASGRLEIEQEDVHIPGKVPLVWDRRYTTALIDRPASFMGRGWTCRYLSTLRYAEGRFEYFTPKGGIEFFENRDGAFARGQVLRNPGAYKELFREGNRAVVRTWDVATGDIWRFVFEAGTLGEAWPLSAIEDVTSVQAVDLVWGAKCSLLKVRQRLECRELVPVYEDSGAIRCLDLIDQQEARRRLVSFVHDEQRNLLEIQDAAGHADRFEYDLQGRITREILKDGGVFNNRYDGSGRCVLSSGLDGYHEKRLRFIDGIRVTEVTNSCGERSLYQHLPSGQVTSITDPLGGRSTTEFDDHGRIVAETNAEGATKRYTYDSQGNRDSIVDELGHQVRFAFNEHHQPLVMLDKGGQRWARAYDERHRLTNTTDPLGGRWSFAYDHEGNLEEVTNPLGAKSWMRSEKGVLQSTTDWIGSATHFRFDPFGRVLERQGPRGDKTRFEYDLAGNPVSVVFADGTRLIATYDQAGNLTQFVDANGRITRWLYGTCSRLIQRTDPCGATVRYVWGSERGRLNSVVNELGESYTFTRDEAGRIVKETSFDGAVRRFGLNAEGQSVSYTNANNETIEFERDALQRVVGQRLPDGQTVRFEFDKLGRLVTVANRDITVAIERDALGRINREIQGDDWVVSHYDAIGNLLQTRTSRGLAVSYRYDANGRMIELAAGGGKRVRFERDLEGRETCRHMPGDTRLEQRFDIMGRLVEQRALSAAASTAHRSDLARREYDYDRDGSLARVVDSCWGRTEYSFDPADRLLAAMSQRGKHRPESSIERFEYDPASNITRMRVESASTIDERLIYGPGNRLDRVGDTLIEYDAEGRRVRMVEDSQSPLPKVWIYEWDPLDRLRRMTRPDGSTWGYQYDGLARRIAKFCLDEGSCADGTPSNVSLPRHERFVWDQDVIVHQVPDGMPSAAWLFEATNFAPLARLVGDSIQVVVNDHLGTPRELFNGDGSMAVRKPGRAWEGCQPDESCPIGFQGQWWDAESGLRYNRYRYYDARVGRYLSDDPTSLLGGIHLQNYGVNPVSWIDPLGLLCKEQRRRLRKIEELAGEPGNDGTKFAVDRREARQLGEAFVGPGHTVERGEMHGEVWLVSADKKRLWRSPTPKDSDFARTGVQSNFHERSNTNSGWFDQQSTSNVHVHVKD